MEYNVFSNEPPDTGPLTFEQAYNLLGLCERVELRDHAFGDRELFWERNESQVAGGYFGGGASEVWIEEEFGSGRFSGEEARRLATRGTRVTFERNDETGPDEYRGR